ncbi:unnamed protein product [Cylicocyclus nassatus]|uniref:Uncharacterized protein n=1 Tax=Cylicocyclus nassatus TaxID=53992 RepID=A0AA36GP70_CYLNA|nr:unnamed protein product [Cylicocyclus nassatus]
MAVRFTYHCVCPISSFMTDVGHTILLNRTRTPQMMMCTSMMMNLLPLLRPESLSPLPQFPPVSPHETTQPLMMREHSPAKMIQLRTLPLRSLRAVLLTSTLALWNVSDCE